VAFLANQIQKAFPNLTVHDITHLDALWETADLIAGPNYPLNPMEAFAFGGSVLLHDAALCFEAYEGGIDGVRNTIQWRDALAAEKERHPTITDEEHITASDFTTIRLLHARQAADLVDKAWTDPGTGQPIFLLDDFDLRKRYGPIIGKIASSHHWPIEEVASNFQHQINAPGDWPNSWRIYTRLESAPIALMKSGFANHLDTLGQQLPFADFLTFIPVKNSNFLSLEGFLPAIEGQASASSPFSFVHCLQRYCEQKGRKLDFELRKDVSRSNWGSIDALILSLR
jgi:hypothetical protein